MTNIQGQEPAPTPTLPELVFNSMVNKIGAPIIKQIFTAAETSWQQGEQGVTIEDDECAAWVMTFDKERSVNFYFHGWGPYMLNFEEASKVLYSSEIINTYLQENAD